MSDYRVRISVRNARLARAIEAAGHRPGAQFAELVGISYSVSLLPYLNLTRSPYGQDGLLRECAWALCDYLRASPSDLWSDAQLQPLKKNHSSIDVDEDGMQALILGAPAAVDPLRMASKAQAGRIVHEAIGSLSPRYAFVIRERFFAGSTLSEVADKLDMTRESVHQIEKKALRMLRNESFIPRELAGVIGGSADA